MCITDPTVVPIEALLSSCERERDALRNENKRVLALLDEAMGRLERCMSPTEYGTFFDKVRRSI